MFEHGGNLRFAAEKYHVREEEIIDFSSNINPLGLPAGVKKIVSDSFKNIIYYPDPENKELRVVLSKVLELDCENILVGNGSIELISIITLALKPERVLISAPAFCEYERSSKLTGTKCIFINSEEEKDFQPDLDKIINNLSETDMLFICNPNNPTGSIFFKDELMRLLNECKRNKVILVLDEAFIDFVEDIRSAVMIKESVLNSNLLILRSLTKFFALPGLRIGYLAGNRNLIKKISKFQYPWSVNYPAQEAAKVAVRDFVYINKSRNYIFREREYLFKRLKKIEGIKPFKPGANFILCRLNDRGINSGELTDLLGKKGILIRDCSNFRGLNNKYFRLAVKKREENRKLIKALEEFIYPCKI